MEQVRQPKGMPNRLKMNAHLFVCPIGWHDWIPGLPIGVWGWGGQAKYLGADVLDSCVDGGMHLADSRGRDK